MSRVRSAVLAGCLIVVSLATSLAASGPGGEVVRGRQVPETDLPWMVSVQFGASGAGDPFDAHGCGGEVLDSRHVLTAAHCVAWPDGRVTDPRKVQVYSGWHVLRPGKGDITAVSAIHVHPDYYAERGTPLERYDVAMLTLAEPIEGIVPAPIVAEGERRWQRPGQVVHVAGWGSTKPYGGGYGERTRFRRQLMAGRLDLIDARSCVERLRSKGIRGLNTEASICAVPDPGGSCWNDSGGPLYVETGTGVVVIGTLSWGFGCGIHGMPEMYTRLSDPPVARWITERLGSS